MKSTSQFSKWALSAMICLACVNGPGLIGTAWAQETETAPKSVNPGINSNYLNPDINVGDWVERFEREGREVFDLRDEIIQAAGVKPGLTVADIGSGTGL